MGLPAWLRLLAGNRFRIDPFGLPRALAMTVATSVSSLLGAAQKLVAPARQPRFDPPPLFILGHWRSGTTWLHELLALDDRHVVPTSYACIFPGHFGLTQRWLGPLAGPPMLRPMDDVVIGWNSPQEDEFALCNLGLPSPYLWFAFPNRGPVCLEYLEMDEVPPAAREEWKRALRGFLGAVAEPGRRVIVKSPPHTFRIPILLELFPDARFVHLVRDPFTVYPSTLRTWRMLFKAFALERPGEGGAERLVLDVFLRMFLRIEATRGLVPEGRFHEIRYEDLRRDPVGRLREMYERLDLGDFEPVRAKVEARARMGYRTNRYSLSRETIERIAAHWREPIERYGYPVP